MIPKIKFELDVEKDLYNIWETANSSLTYGYNFKKNLSPNILQICENKKYKTCKKILKKTMHKIHGNKLIKQSTKSLNESWKTIEKEYFLKLENMTKQKFSFKKINVYLTTAGRCPYRPHWNPPAFYVNFFNHITNALHTAGHELMHIHLHNIDWWENVEKEIGYEKTHDLKEALTELLNLEFRELWIIEDKGYPNHKKLREYIKKQWQKEKNFDKLTKNCIKWIKRYGIK